MLRICTIHEHPARFFAIHASGGLRYNSRVEKLLMRIAHLGDLHLGRRIGDYSITGLQRQIMLQIADKVEKKEIDTVIIAGDIYDSAVPDAEAVSVLSEFLTKLRNANKDVFMIAGNHDRGDYIEYGSALFKDMDIHVEGTWKGKLECVDLLDRFGPLHMYCLPYISPAAVNQFIEKEEDKVHDYTSAVQYAINTADIDWNERNVLVAHQFVEGAKVTVNGSEDFLSFGQEEVDPSVFDGFEYVALGHIHSAQSVYKDTIRYCGAPLKYAITEMNEERSFALIDLGDKDQYRISTVRLDPEQDMEQLRGRFDDLVNPEFAVLHNHNFVQIVLEEKRDIPDAISVLREYYPYILGVSYADGRIQTNHVILTEEDFTVKREIMPFKETSPIDLFSEFYEQRKNTSLNDRQKEYMDFLVEDVFHGEES